MQKGICLATPARLRIQEQPAHIIASYIVYFNKVRLYYYNETRGQFLLTFSCYVMSHIDMLYKQ